MIINTIISYGFLSCQIINLFQFRLLFGSSVTCQNHPSAFMWHSVKNTSIRQLLIGLKIRVFLDEHLSKDSLHTHTHPHRHAHSAAPASPRWNSPPPSCHSPQMQTSTQGPPPGDAQSLIKKHQKLVLHR